ncbi:retrovirus-related pol polyprotein from transposon TNT 1-94, partial [Tanacetum coccineum]
VDNTAQTRRPQPRSNIKIDRVPSVSKSSCIKNKDVEVEEHLMNLLLSKNKRHISSECNNIKLAIRNDKSEVVCVMCKQCLITGNHDVCVLNYVNGMNSRGMKQRANVSNTEKQKKQNPKVRKSKKLGSKERLASPTPSKPRSCLRWSPTGRIFDLKGKITASSESECCSKHMTENLKLLINFIWKFLGTVRFGNDHVAAILGYGDLQWGNILINRVYFVEGLGHNLFSVGQFCDSDLEVAFRRNTCFVRNLEGVDLLKGNRTTNLYTINLYEMASASPICLMARATSTKSWLWHQRLSHLNFDTINDLAKNDLVSGLPKFKYSKEHLCPSCEQGKSKRVSHPPKPVPNSKQRLHLLHMDLCGLMRVESINGSVEAARTMLLFSHAPLFLWDEVIATACYTQNRSIIHRRFKKTPYELINGRKSDISFLHVFEALCYPKNDREDIGKLGAKGDIGFFIGYYANSCSYRVYNRRTKKIIETMNVTFDELSMMAFEQRSSKPGLQSMTSRQISSGLDLTYAPTALAAQAPQVLQTPTTSTTTSDTALTSTNSSSQATNIPNTSQDVNELETQQHVQQQDNEALLQPEIVVDNVPNAMLDGNTFVNPFPIPSTSVVESSSLQYVDPSNMHTFYQPYPHEYQWTKDHPLEQVIGEPS